MDEHTRLTCSRANSPAAGTEPSAWHGFGMHPPELSRYTATSKARDWVLHGAVGYLKELESVRSPSQRRTMPPTTSNDWGFTRPFVDFAFKRLAYRCTLQLVKSEDSRVDIESARRAGFGGENALVCLAGLQYAYALRILAKRLSKQGDSDELLWGAYVDLMYFCHSDACSLYAVYEEHRHRQPIDRKTPRDPKESYIEWRRRASPTIVEVRPKSIQYMRSYDSPVVWREDRSGFHRDWIERKLANAWRDGSRPFMW